MFNYYEEQPASPLVEWIRYANRRAKDLQELPKRFREQAASTLAIFALAWLVVGPEKALDRLVALIIAALVSVVVLPSAKWVLHFAKARHALLKEENGRLIKDNTALSETVATIQEQLADCQKADKGNADLKAQVPAKPQVIQGRPNAVIFDVEPPMDAVRKEGAKRLADLRERAIKELANRRISNENELPALKREIAEWEREVLKMLEQYAGVDEITTFRVLGTYTTRVTGGVNADHNRELGMLWERIKRLEKVIARLST